MKNFIKQLSTLFGVFLLVLFIVSSTSCNNNNDDKVKELEDKIAKLTNAKDDGDDDRNSNKRDDDRNSNKRDDDRNSNKRDDERNSNTRDVEDIYEVCDCIDMMAEALEELEDLSEDYYDEKELREDRQADRKADRLLDEVNDIGDACSKKFGEEGEELAEECYSFENMRKLYRNMERFY